MIKSDLCDLKFICTRKHTLNDKVYEVYVRQNQIVIGDKYLISLSENIIIEWKLGKKLEAFGLRCGRELKWFYADQSDLIMLKNHLRVYAKFTNFQDFYTCEAFLAGDEQQGLYLVKDKLTSQNRISKTVLNEGKFRKQILNEISILKHLNHPNIVKFYETFEDKQYQYAIEEYLPYGTLSYFLNEIRQLSQDNIKNFMKDILSGLKYLNSRNIIHRDIKPENIMLTKDRTLKIIDFGLATNRQEKQICGTPGYIAPEILQNQACSPKSDVFSAGCVFYEMITGKCLFPDDFNLVALKANKNSQLNLQVLKTYKHATAQMMELIKLMLEYDPQKRISAEQALSHNFFVSSHHNFSSKKLLSTKCYSNQNITDQELPLEGVTQFVRVRKIKAGRQ